MKKSIVLFIAFVFLTSIAWSQAPVAGDFRSNVNTGNWGDAATWQRYDGGGWVAAPSYPGEFGGTGVVTIQDGHSITLNNSPANSIGSLVIQTGGTATTLTIGAFTLNVTGNVLIDVSTGNINKTIAVTPSGVLNCASLTMAEGNNDNRKSYLTFILGTVNVTGDITMGADPDRTYLQFLSGGTLNIGGTITGGNITPGTGTVNFNNNGPQSIPGYSYNNLTVSNGFPSQTKYLAGIIPSVTGNFILTSTLLEMRDFNITLNAAAATTATCHIQTNGRLVLNGTGQLLKTAGGGNEALVIDFIGYLDLKSPSSSIPVMDNYTIDPSSYLTYSCSCNQTINTNLNWGRVYLEQLSTKTVTADFSAVGITISSVTTLAVSGSQTITLLNVSVPQGFNNDGTFSPGTGKVVFVGNNVQTIGGASTTNFYNLEVNKGGNYLAVNNSISVSNTLTLTNRNIQTAGNTITLTNPIAANQLSGGSGNSNVISTGAGRLRRNGLLSGNTYSFPVASSYNNYYMPVTVTPASATSDFAVNVYEGVTTNGVEGGPAEPNKDDLIDAVWNIDRLVGSGNAAINISNIDLNLVGINLISDPSITLGVTRYAGGWQSTTGTADWPSQTADATFSSFSPFNIRKEFVVLPLKLVSFDASTSNCSSLVKWKTTNEVNVDHFELQVSYDNNNWSTVQTLAATNNPSDISNYSVSFNHSNRSGNKSLRLKMVDIDGKFTYSKIISVQCGKDNVLSVYPNPATNAITLTGTKTNDRVQVIGMDGRTVLNLLATEGNTQLNIENLASGTYQIRVLNNTNWIDAGRFVKQ